MALNLQRRDLAEKIMSLSADDVVVFFAFQAPASLPAGYEGLIAYSSEMGAKSIVISDSTWPTIRPRADVTLSVSRPDDQYATAFRTYFGVRSSGDDTGAQELGAGSDWARRAGKPQENSFE